MEKEKKSVEERFAEFEQRLKAGKEAEDDLEIRDALLEKGRLLIDENRLDQGLEILKEAQAIKDVSAAKKEEVLLEMMRVAVRRVDSKQLELWLADCKKLEEGGGGDWEKKNKRKVFSGIWNMMIRNFTDAAKLLLEAVPTFTATDVISFEQLVSYASLMAVVAQTRDTLRKKVVHSPEVLVAVPTLLKQFANSFYYCDYSKLFSLFPDVIDNLRKDPFLGKHTQFYVKQLRVRAYGQYLESYRSVTIPNMAQAFNVPESFIDAEISHFISIGRLACKIDKVSQVVHSKVKDSRAEQYSLALRSADSLLNRLQKLARALAV